MNLFLVLKKVLFGDIYFDKFCSMEDENAELKFKVQVLELQLNTMKKKNEELITKKDLLMLDFKSQITELLKEQLVVTRRISCVLDVLKDL